MLSFFLKEEEHGAGRVSAARPTEAKATSAQILVVGCPFCLTMLSGAAMADAEQLGLLVVAEIVAERLK